jgi:hypothetical protein
MWHNIGKKKKKYQNLIGKLIKDMLFVQLLHNNCTIILMCLAFFLNKKIKMLNTSALLCNCCATNISQLII